MTKHPRSHELNLLFREVLLMYLNIGESGRVISKYHETCLNQTCSEPAFVFRINRCPHYASYINKDFL